MEVGMRVKYAGLKGQILVVDYKHKKYRIKLDKQGNGERPLVIGVSFNSIYLKEENNEDL